MTLSELCLKKRTLSSVLHLGREGVGGDSLKHPSPLRVSASVNPGAACLWLDPFLPRVALAWLMYPTRLADSLHGCNYQTAVTANGKSRGWLICGRPSPRGRGIADGVTCIDLKLLESQYRERCGPLVKDAGYVPRLKGPLADEHPPVKAGTREYTAFFLTPLTLDHE